jgi:hypothetical protein
VLGVLSLGFPPDIEGKFVKNVEAAEIWVRRGNGLPSWFAERENDFLPTRSIHPSAMGNNYGAVFRKSPASFLSCHPIFRV